MALSDPDDDEAGVVHVLCHPHSQCQNESRDEARTLSRLEPS